ncbi:MAG: UDP-glucose 4-epimerase GalE [Caulobacterales bacterium]
MFGNAPSKISVLVTGGAGYIGAHAVKALAERGLTPVVFDDLSAGHPEALRWGEFVRGDVRDRAALCAAMREHRVGAVMHFAGLIEVAGSVADPDRYFDVNVGGVDAVLAAMSDCGVQRLVFSSSAAVYGRGPAGVALAEDHPKDPASPYGETKLVAERMIAAHCAAFGATAVALRYFNAAGADASGLIGEAHEPETHLIPLAIAAGLGNGPPLSVYGTDFDTPDGSCVRDYVHVNDLAQAHMAALALGMPHGDFEAFNVGTGRGCSVLQVIDAVERALGAPVPRSACPRRDGDPASLISEPAYALDRLGWRPADSDLDEIVRSAVAWHRSPAYGGGVKPGRDLLRAVG